MLHGLMHSTAYAVKLQFREELGLEQTAILPILHVVVLVMALKVVCLALALSGKALNLYHGCILPQAKKLY